MESKKMELICAYYIGNGFKHLFLSLSLFLVVRRIMYPKRIRMISRLMS